MAALVVVVVTTTIARKIDVEKDPSLGGSSALDLGLGLHEFLIHVSCAGTKSFAVLQCKPVAGF